MEWWVLIPIAGIFAGLLKDLVRIRAKQQDLGTSNRELEKVVDELRQTNQTLAQRVENLETIVVSQTWNAVSAPASDAERQLRLAAAVRHEVHAPAPEEVNRQRAADLARRLGG